MLRVNPEPGKYVVAVSGGVDSVVLLDLLNKQKNLELVVAHFDHGIREDSGDDKKFVETLAKKYKLPFEFAEGKLGKNASEAEARKVRYEFLENVRVDHKAKAIVTAHHQDDLLETIILNLLRGTGRKGITSLSDQEKLKRPFLGVTKQELINYAKQYSLTWHEDSTNIDTNYLRNKIRQEIVPRLSENDRQKFLDIHAKLSRHNPEIDKLLAEYQKQEKTLDKRNVINSDHVLAKELISSWLRTNGVTEFDRKIIERIVISAKTLKPGKTIPVKKGVTIEIQKDLLLLKP